MAQVNLFNLAPLARLRGAILIGTGVGELRNVVDYADYIDLRDEEEAAGGHWSGWTFALRTIPQRNMRIAMMPHVLYVALKLSIHVGGNLALQGWTTSPCRCDQCAMHGLQRIKVSDKLHPGPNLWRSLSTLGLESPT